jgi:alkylated DNA repair protein (DNA oxidative demethylase)
MTANAALVQTELFGASLLPGLATGSEFLTATEEAALIAYIEGAELTPFRFQQWEGKRLTRSYGWHYDFETSAFSRTEPLPAWLRPIADRAAQFAGVAPARIAQALLISYGPGAGIGWHRDRPVFEHVIGISLGSPAAMRFRRRKAEKFERFALSLAPRSIYHLKDEVRTEWEHSIAAMVEPRWSITLRTLRDPYGP